MNTDDARDLHQALGRWLEDGARLAPVVTAWRGQAGADQNDNINLIGDALPEPVEAAPAAADPAPANPPAEPAIASPAPAEPRTGSCEICGGSFSLGVRGGNRKKFCSPACKSRAYDRRKAAQATERTDLAEPSKHLRKSDDAEPEPAPPAARLEPLEPARAARALGNEADEPRSFFVRDTHEAQPERAAALALPPLPWEGD